LIPRGQRGREDQQERDEPDAPPRRGQAPRA
jgi:hypothetical protein